MHGGHSGGHFDIKITKMFVKSSRYRRNKIVSKYGNLISINDVFCMAATLAAILKKLYENVREVDQILEKKIGSKYENLIFYQRRFLHGGHIGVHFEKES